MAETKWCSGAWVDRSYPNHPSNPCGVCGACGRWVRARKNGQAFRHKRSA